MSLHGRLPGDGFVALGGAPCGSRGAGRPVGGSHPRDRSGLPGSTVCAARPARAAAPHAPRLAALAPTAGGRAPGFDFLDRLRR